MIDLVRATPKNESTQPRARWQQLSRGIAALATLAAAGCAGRPDVPPESQRTQVVELPRPNSGAFSFDEAERRRGEILTMAPSGMLHDWHNPYCGFGLHLDAQGRLTVYLSDSTNEARVLAGWPQLRDEVEFCMRLGDSNPVGVLITSDHGGESPVLPRVVDELFRPSIQVFYLRAAGG